MSSLLTAAMVVFLEGLSFGIALPVLTAYAVELGGTVATGSIMFALATAPRVFFALFWGRISDHMGRRPVFSLIGLGTATASLLWGMCEPLGQVAFGGLVWLLVSRAVYGCFAAQSVLGMAVASDVSAPERRAASMGILGAAFGVAFTVGPAIGGAVAHAWGAASIGYLAAGAQLLGVVLVVARLKETHPLKTRQPEQGAAFVPPTALFKLASAPMIAWLLLICFVSTAGYSVLMPTFQQLAENWYGFTVLKAGAALSVFGLAGALVQGGMIRPTVRSIGEKATALLGSGLLAMGLGGVASHPGQAWFWVALIVAALGTGFTVPAITALLSLSVGEHDQGAIHGLNQSATSLGRAGGYLLGGFVYTHASPAAAYLAAALVAAASLLMLVPTRGPTRHGTGDEGAGPMGE